MAKKPTPTLSWHGPRAASCSYAPGKRSCRAPFGEKRRQRAGAKSGQLLWPTMAQMATTNNDRQANSRSAGPDGTSGPAKRAGPSRQTAYCGGSGAWNVCFVPPRCSPPFSTALFCANDAMQPFTAFGRHRPILRDAARQLRLHDDRLLPLKSIRCGNLAVCEKNLLQDGILPFCIYIRLCHPSRLSQRFAANVRNIG